jgi:diacylglycerol kinase
MGKKHSLKRSFIYAFAGLSTALRNEPNLRIHFIMAMLALLLAFFLGLTSVEWLILTLSIFLVIILELLNSVLEQIVNLASPEIKKEAKIAKDVSAAIVLIAAVFSIIVGAILFIPKIVLIL